MASIFLRAAASISVSIVLVRIAGAQAPADGFTKVEPGFLARDRVVLPARTALGGIAYAPDGSPIALEGNELRLYTGDSSRLLTSFDDGISGSFAVMSSDGRAVIIGAGPAGDIYRVPLEGGERVLIDHIQSNYDLVFDRAGRGLVSANPGVQQILLLDNDPALDDRAVIGNIPGLSGPLALDAAGNLYYGTAVFSGDPPFPQTLHRFSAAQLESAIGGSPIDFSEGDILLEDFPGFAGMRWHEEKLYVSDLGFGGGLGRVLTIDLARGLEVKELATFPFEGGILSPTFLAILPGSKPFAPGSGRAGGLLLVAYSDFQTVTRVAEIVPELHFVRGRINGDERIDLSDSVALLDFLFLGQKAPEVPEAADVNGDGSTDISDAMYLLNFLFLGGPKPPLPFPEPGPAPPPGG
jgi:hypothetical protein